MHWRYEIRCFGGLVIKWSEWWMFIKFIYHFLDSFDIQIVSLLTPFQTTRCGHLLTIMINSCKAPWYKIPMPTTQWINNLIFSNYAFGLHKTNGTINITSKTANIVPATEARRQWMTGSADHSSFIHLTGYLWVCVSQNIRGKGY